MESERPGNSADSLEQEGELAPDGRRDGHQVTTTAVLNALRETQVRHARAIDELGSAFGTIREAVLHNGEGIVALCSKIEQLESVQLEHIVDIGVLQLNQTEHTQMFGNQIELFKEVMSGFSELTKVVIAVKELRGQSSS